MNRLVQQALLLTTTTVLALPGLVHAQWKYSTDTDNGQIIITGYSGPGGAVAIPDKINTLPVRGIRNWAFVNQHSLTSVKVPDSVGLIGTSAFNFCSNLTSITIGHGITNIGNWAFVNCTGLTGVYFTGNAPEVGRKLFDGDTGVTVYHLAGAAGWESTFSGCPTACWAPQAQTNTTQATRSK